MSIVSHLACVVVALICFFKTANSLSITMSRKEPYCIGIMGNATYNYEMNYHTLGKGNTQIKYDLYDPYNNIIKTGTGNRTEYFKQKIYQDGIYTICFTNLDNNSKKINFDVVASPDEQASEVLEMEHLRLVEWELKSMYESLERISRMLNANIERTQQQITIRRQGKSSVEWWVFYKGLAIFVI